MQTVRITLLLALITVSGVASAGYFDGKAPLLCSVYRLFECDHPNGCIAVKPEDIDAMSHFQIDFKEKLLIPLDTEPTRRSVIQQSAVVDNKLIIQGIEDGMKDERDGAGWSVSIMDPEGTMVFAIAGDGFGVMGLGACSPQP
jgi:hypothetical protein